MNNKEAIEALADIVLLGWFNKRGTEMSEVNPATQGILYEQMLAKREAEIKRLRNAFTSSVQQVRDAQAENDRLREERDDDHKRIVHLAQLERENATLRIRLAKAESILLEVWADCEWTDPQMAALELVIDKLKGEE